MLLEWPNETPALPFSGDRPAEPLHPVPRRGILCYTFSNDFNFFQREMLNSSHETCKKEVFL